MQSNILPANSTQDECIDRGGRRKKRKPERGTESREIRSEDKSQEEDKQGGRQIECHEDDNDLYAEWDPHADPHDAPFFVLLWVPHNGGVGEHLFNSDAAKTHA